MDHQREVIWMMKKNLAIIALLIIVISLTVITGVLYLQIQILNHENQILNHEKDVLQSEVEEVQAPYLINIGVTTGVKPVAGEYGQDISLWRIWVSGSVLNAGLETAENVRFEVVAYGTNGEELFRGETNNQGSIVRYETITVYGYVVTDLTTDTYIDRLEASPICDNSR